MSTKRIIIGDREVSIPVLGIFPMIGIGLVLWLLTGTYIVGPDEVGVSKGHPVLVGHGFVRGRGEWRGILDSKEAIVKMRRDAIGVLLGHGGRIHPGKVEDVAEHLELLGAGFRFHGETVDCVLG